jgi:hypothetical protein
MTSPFTQRPLMAFRVGVTGTRVISPETAADLRAKVSACLGVIRARMAALAADPELSAFYAPAPPLLRVVSPLAEGADRLVAEEALSLGYRLTAPLPFAQADYEADFPDSVDAFRALLAAAGEDVLALDGGRGAQEARSYEAVGRLVVRHCDLLIAIWDGKPAKGRGGTAEIVRYAARHGQPIWWITPDGAAPVWAGSLRALQGGGAGQDPEAALARYLDSFIRPPPMPPKPASGLISQFVAKPDLDPLGTLLAETRRPKSWYWQAYRGLIGVMSWPAARERGAPPPPPPATPVWTYWQGFYQPIDELAVSYGDRYRSSYVLLFGLAAVAVIGAVLGLWGRGPIIVATAIEFLCIMLIGALVVVNLREGWHARLIGYRLLAELFRKQQALGSLGWSLPAAEAVPEMAMIDQLLATREAWVGWYFNASLRAAPLPRGALAGAQLAAARDAVAATLVTGQAAYHANRREQSRAAADRLGHAGEALFLATLVLVALKLAMLIAGDLHMQGGLAGSFPAGIEAVGLVAAILPALSAGFVGIRGYAELELLADQSAQMEVWIKTAAARIEAVDISAPMASQELGVEVLDLAQRMLLDIQGWAQLFRLKAVEPT